VCSSISHSLFFFRFFPLFFKAKLRLSEPPHDYRHRFTRDLRIAFQNGRVSSPVQRNLMQLDDLDEEESEIVELKTKHDHVFFLRTHYRPVNSHHHQYNHVKAPKYVSTAENVTSGRAHAIVSGPNNTVRIRNDEGTVSMMCSHSGSVIFCPIPFG